MALVSLSLIVALPRYQLDDGAGSAAGAGPGDDARM